MTDSVGVRTKPEPYCPDCGAAHMKLRRPRPGQDWQPFWGCTNFPECRGVRQIDDDGLPQEDAR